MPNANTSLLNLSRRDIVNLFSAELAFTSRQCYWASPVSEPTEKKLCGSLQSYFATPVWTFTFPRAEAVNTKLREVILEAAVAYPSQGKSNIGGWRSRNDIFHWPCLEANELGSWILDCLRQIVEAYNTRERYRGELSVVGWATVCRFGDYNAPHIHPDAAWSGAYYVDTGDADETTPVNGCLELLDPRPAAGGVNTPGDPFGHPVRIPPVAGQLVVFPSWLLHWVHPHSGRRERIAISFNASFANE